MFNLTPKKLPVSFVNKEKRVHKKKKNTHFLRTAAVGKKRRTGRTCVRIVVGFGVRNISAAVFLSAPPSRRYIARAWHCHWI